MIRIITTGGTIEGLDYQMEEERPLKVRNKIDEIFSTANLQYDYIFERVFYKDSRLITSADRNLLATKIKLAKETKVLITHGTITMVKTARFLGKLNLEKTIVLVGSFILGTDKNSDAPFNLGYAICALQNLDSGVYVAMNGYIFSWNNVVKIVAKKRFEENA